MDGDGLGKCIATLERLAQLYPAQPEWAEWAEQLRAAPAPPEAKPGNVPPGPAPAAGACIGCRRRSVTEGAELCLACRRLYRPVSAGAVRDCCSCGHLPASERIFVFQLGERELTLCGPACVAEHYRTMFGFFLERLAWCR
jgi:hypothetical protein